MAQRFSPEIGQESQALYRVSPLALSAELNYSTDIDSPSPLHGVNGIFNKIDKDTLGLLRYESTREMGVN